MALTALFTCRSSPYLALGLECYDYQRDARTFAGSGPVIAHPPCRSWGRYKNRSKHLPEERELALWALDLVRRNGGVLEHPASSSLWAHLQPGDRTIVIKQCDFGHRAEKRTRLFVAHLCPPPAFPFPYTGPLVPVEQMGRQERERTPVAFAQWLLTWCHSHPALKRSEGGALHTPSSCMHLKEKRHV